jgi:hypothetical protein
MHDLTAQDLSERQFFEEKFRAYKEYMEKQGDAKEEYERRVKQRVKTILAVSATFCLIKQRLEVLDDRRNLAERWCNIYLGDSCIMPKQIPDNYVVQDKRYPWTKEDFEEFFAFYENFR